MEWQAAMTDREQYIIVRPFRVPVGTASDQEPLLLLFVRNAPQQVAKRAIARAQKSENHNRVVGHISI